MFNVESGFWVGTSKKVLTLQIFLIYLIGISCINGGIMNRIFESSIKEGAASFDDMSLPELDEAEEVIRGRMSSIVFHSSDTAASTLDDVQSFNLHRLVQIASAKKRISGENKDADK